MFAERLSSCCLESLIKSCARKPNPSQFSLLLFLLMAGVPAGPLQHGRGVQGQYVYAIIFPQPTVEVLATHDLKQPSDFDGQAFRELIVKCHAECDVTLVETAFFKEPHANGDFHLNLLVRASSQYRWKKVARLMCGARADANCCSLRRRSRERLQIQRFL